MCKEGGGVVIESLNLDLMLEKEANMARVFGGENHLSLNSILRKT